MNAVLDDYDVSEGADMPETEIQVAELRADVRHIQSDVTDIKADLRTTKQSVEALRKETGEQFNALRKETYETLTQIRESLASAKVWALGLYITLAGSLFFVLAHGFKWI
jgi:uncharacterized protein YlxW (UPF0749 family)